MRAVCWCGTGRIQVQQVPDPLILDPRDAIIRVTATTVCGSDLHLLDGFVPTMKPGDILGHEIVGEIVELGSSAGRLQKGQRVVVSPLIACGRCWFCQTQQYSLCDNSNPNGWMQERLYIGATAGVFGFSHLFGGYAGGQAEYVRVPYADIGAFPIPDGMNDEQALACADAFPTGYMAAELCEIRPGNVVAVWGCGPVGLFALKSALLLGAEKVIAIDNVRERLRLAMEHCGATSVNHDEVNVMSALRSLTGGRGPDACIDAVGMEAHGANLLEDWFDKAKTRLRVQNDRLAVLRQMIQCCRKGGVLSVVGVYAGMSDMIPLGPAFTKGLRIHLGQMHGQKIIPRLFEHWEQGQVDPAFLYTHRMPLEQAPHAYQIFRDKAEGCVKVVLKP